MVASVRVTDSIAAKELSAEESAGGDASKLNIGRRTVLRWLLLRIINDRLAIGFQDTLALASAVTKA